MKLVNLTGHPVTLGTGSGRLVLPANPNPARLTESFESIGDVGGVPLFAATLGAPVNLPDPEPGTLLIVPSVLRTAVTSRFDLVSPCQFERDEEGNVVAANGLCGSHWAAKWLHPCES